MLEEQILQGKDFVVNRYRTRKIRDISIITTDHGSWEVISQDELSKLQREEFDDELFSKLEKVGVILTKKNIPSVLSDYRKRFSFLYRGASLHIIVPTLRCNYKCKYCHSSVVGATDTTYDMDEETMKATVDFIFQSPSPRMTIEFQGGETLLAKNMFRGIVEYAKQKNKVHKKNIRFALVTNLSLMTDELLKYIIENNISICTSVDGPEFLHNEYRILEGGKGSYHITTRMMKKIQLLYNYPVASLMVTSKECLSHPKKIVDEYVKLGQTSLQLKPMSKMGFALGNWDNIGYEMEEFFEFWKEAVDYMIELNKKGIRIKERYVGIVLQKILSKQDPSFLDFRYPAGSLTGVIAYDYKGDIFSSDEGRAFELFNLGNTKTHSYRQVMQSPKARSIIDAGINDNFLCDNCAYKTWCGICPEINYASTGNILSMAYSAPKCKQHMMVFDYVFEKYLFDPEVREIFMDWLNNWENKQQVKRTYNDFLRLLEENLLSNYPLNEIHGIVDVSKGGKRSYAVQTDQGTYMVRVYGFIDKDLTKDLEKLQYILLTDKVPLASLVKTTDSQASITFDNLHFLLFSYPSVESFNGSDEHVHLATELFTKLYSDTSSRFTVSRDFNEESQKFLEKFREDSATIADLSLTLKLEKPQKDALKKRMDFFQSAIEKAQKALTAELPSHPLIGDLSLPSLGFLSDSAVVTNFDDIIHGPRVYDAATLVSSLIEKEQYTLFSKTVDALKLTRQERALLPSFLRLYYLKKLTSIVGVTKDTVSILNSGIQMLVWLDSNERKLKTWLKLD